MLDPLDLLVRLRSHSAAAPKPPAGTSPTADHSHAAAPVHLKPGARVHDTVTGQEGEVIAYGRATALAEAPPA